MRHDLTVGEFAHLLADRIECVVEAAGADGRVRPLAHQFGEPRAARRSVAGGDQMIDGRRHARRHGRRAQSEIGKAHDLALAHRDAAEHLRQIFAGADAHQKLFGLAEGARRHQAARHKRQAAGSLRHRSRARQVRGWRAVPGRTRAPSGRPSTVTRAATARRASANSASAAVTASCNAVFNSWPAGLAIAAGDMDGSKDLNF